MRRLAFLLGLLLAAGTVPLPADTPEVVIVSPNWDGIKEETARAFNDWHRENYGTPAMIRWRDIGGGSQIIRFLRSEYKSSPAIGIDVLFGAGVDPYRDLEKSGLLEPVELPTATLNEIPATLNGVELRDPKNCWFGYALAGFGILTNERVRTAANLPPARNWTDLADPRLAGWISACDPRASSSALAIYEIILQARGWADGWRLLMEISGNTRNFVPSAAASVVEVGTGDAAYGVSIDFYGHAQVAYYGADNVTFTLPAAQTVITPDCVAVLKNPPHPEMARRFIAFELSRTGQLLWMLPEGAPGGAVHYAINRMSVWPSLYTELAGRTPVRSDPFSLPAGFAYSAPLAAQRRQVLSVLIATCMIDTHDVLARAWRQLNAHPNASAALREELLAPPCTQEELLHLAATDWNDPVRRTALTNRWQADALRRYQDVLAKIP